MGSRNSRQGRQRCDGRGRRADGGGGAELRGGAEQGQDVASGGVLGEEVEGAHRVTPLPGQMGGGDQPAQRAPAAAAASRVTRGS